MILLHTTWSVYDRVYTNLNRIPFFIINSIELYLLEDISHLTNTYYWSHTSRKATTSIIGWHMTTPYPLPCHLLQSFLLLTCDILIIVFSRTWKIHLQLDSWRYSKHIIAKLCCVNSDLWNLYTILTRYTSVPYITVNHWFLLNQ